MVLSIADVESQLRAIGVRPGGVLLVHTSYRAVGSVEGGPRGLIRALRNTLGPNGTLVMPTMTDGGSPFDPRSTPSVGMGITAELFWREEGVVRSTHPGGSFAAAGPLAEGICAPQPLSPPHGVESPPGRAHELGGQVLLLGVGHSENTTLHVAESIAGVPYSIEHLCVVEVNGAHQSVLVAETDHCCRGFGELSAWLGAREKRGKVGNADAILCESREIVAVALERLEQDPLVFLCPASTACEECNSARLSVRRSPRA